MKNTKVMAMGAMMAVLSGGSLLAGDGFFGGGPRVDIRIGNHDRDRDYGYNDRDRDRFWREKENLRRDEDKAFRLREEIARDRAKMHHHLREGREREARMDARELARDEREYRELMICIERARVRLYGDDRGYRGGYPSVNGSAGYGYRR